MCKFTQLILLISNKITAYFLSIITTLMLLKFDVNNNKKKYQKTFIFIRDKRINNNKQKNDSNFDSICLLIFNK